MKIKDEGDDLEREMDRFITMGEDVTAENTKFVFKKLIKFDQQIKDSTEQKGVTRAQFWKWLKKKWYFAPVGSDCCLPARSARRDMLREPLLPCCSGTATCRAAALEGRPPLS